MKKIEATVETAKVAEIKSALDDMGIRRVTLGDAQPADNPRHHGVYRGCEFPQDQPAQARVQVVLADALVDEAVATIIRAAGHLRLTVTDLGDLDLTGQHTVFYRGHSYAVAHPADRIEMVVPETHPGHEAAAIFITPNGIKVSMADTEELARHTHRGLYRGTEYSVEG
jgi:nitrogen regulatory protein P-II 1